MLQLPLSHSPKGRGGKREKRGEREKKEGKEGLRSPSRWRFRGSLEAEIGGKRGKGGEEKRKRKTIPTPPRCNC